MKQKCEKGSKDREKVKVKNNRDIENVVFVTETSTVRKSPQVCTTRIGKVF